MAETKFNLPRNAYTPGGISILKEASVADARKEYTRLRSIIQKRLKRLGESEFAESPIYKNYKDYFKKLADIQPEKIGLYLSQAYRFLTNPRSSVTGQRKVISDTLRALHEHGFKRITRKNLRQFGEFMDAARMKMGKVKLPSDKIAELFEEVEKKKLNPEVVMEDFQFWLDNLEALKEIETRKGKDSLWYRQRISGNIRAFLDGDE